MPDEIGDETGNVIIKLPLNFNTINQAQGNCYFLVNYAGESGKSNEFEISKKLIVSLLSDAFFSDPGDQIIVSGSAVKLNGELVEGEVEISIPLLSLLEVGVEEDVEEVNESTGEESDEASEEETNEEESSVDKENCSDGYEAVLMQEWFRKPDVEKNPLKAALCRILFGSH